MIHTEYKLTVKKDIKESSGREVFPVKYKVGDILVVDEPTFLNLQSGETIERFTLEGFIRFDKYNFENEVAYTEVIVHYGTKRLGQRKAKEL